MKAKHQAITLSDFADIFGTSLDKIPERCREVVRKSDFRYRMMEGSEREEVFLRVLKTLNSESLKVSGPHRKPDWEKGWSENLQNFRANRSDLNQLIPGFVKQKEIVRFRGNYIMPED